MQLAFQRKDMDQNFGKKRVILLSTASPTMLPVQRKIVEQTRANEKELMDLNNEINCSEPHRNKVLLLRRRSVVTAIGDNKINLGNVIKEIKTVNTGLVLTGCSNDQKSFLGINTNKKSNDPTSFKAGPCQTVSLPYHGEKQDSLSICNTSRRHNNVLIADYSAYSKSTTSNDSKNQSQLHATQFNNKFTLKDNISMKTVSRYNPKTISLDHRYSSLTKSRIHPMNSKVKQESEQLRKRLEELRERRKQEEMKMVRLQTHLIELEKKMKEHNREDIMLPNSGGGNKPTEASNKSNWLIREKEEYENLLKDVREMKLKILRERHNQELQNIRRLQVQMTNLRKKMKDNDEKEIALVNLRQTNNFTVSRPDWMKREEEEYENLLQDVRKIKQNYQLSKKNRESPVKSAKPKYERVLSDENCVLIETIQKKSKLMEKVGDGNKSIPKLEPRISDNDDYGEVIGEIDEDSMDIDMSNEVMILNFNEDLPDPGLLAS